MEQTLEQVIGRNVAHHRSQRGMNQTELGVALEGPLGAPWQRQSVWAAENGKRSFAAADLVGLANVLDVTIGDLLTTSEAVTVGKAKMSPETLLGLSAGGMDTSYLYRIFLAASEVKNSIRNSQILYDDLVRVLQYSVAENKGLREAIEQDLDRAAKKAEAEARPVAENDGIDISTRAKFEKYLRDWDWSTPQMKTARDVLKG